MPRTFKPALRSWSDLNAKERSPRDYAENGGKSVDVIYILDPQRIAAEVQAGGEPFDIDRWRAGDDAVLRAVKGAALELGAPEAVAHEAGVRAACGDWFSRRYQDPAHTWGDPELTVRWA